MKIALVGCVKSKRAEPAPVKDLYTSALFRGRRRWVEHTCDRWFVLSAKHGLVEPDDVLAPYDMTLTQLSRVDRRQWSARVVAALAAGCGPLEAITFEIHAGAKYTEFGLVEGLRRAGAKVEAAGGRALSGKTAPPLLVTVPTESCLAPRRAGSGATRAGRWRRGATGVQFLDAARPSPAGRCRSRPS